MVSQLVPHPRLTIPVPPANAFSFAALYRLSKDDALPTFFELAWRSAYPALSSLMGPACTATTALQLTGRLLAAPPSESLLDSLAAKVSLLQPHLDNAALRNAPAADRVTKIESLLQSSGSSTSSGAGTSATTASGAAADSSSKDHVVWARVLDKPDTKTMVTALEALNVTHLVEYRVARLLLSSPSPLGIHIVRETKASISPSSP